MIIEQLQLHLSLVMKNAWRSGAANSLHVSPRAQAFDFTFQALDRRRSCSVCLSKVSEQSRDSRIRLQKALIAIDVVTIVYPHVLDAFLGTMACALLPLRYPVRILRLGTPWAAYISIDVYTASCSER